jgi:cytochrome bd-type quinol oxidase subunit 2
MSPNQKMAWGNVVVWGSYLVVLTIVLAANGTILFWEEDSLKNAFFTITGVAVAAFITMMLFVWIRASRARATIDERDHKIMNRANALAGPVAMTALAVTSLVLGLVYIEDKNSVMSPYFLMYVTLINVVVYWLAQAIHILVAYRRD